MPSSFLQKVRSLAPARGDLKADAVAGLTFAVVAVPQAVITPGRPSAGAR